MDFNHPNTDREHRLARAEELAALAAASNDPSIRAAYLQLAAAFRDLAERHTDRGRERRKDC